jgi:hypothetical protein
LIDPSVTTERLGKHLVLVVPVITSQACRHKRRLGQGSPRAVIGELLS